MLVCYNWNMFTGNCFPILSGKGINTGFMNKISFAWIPILVLLILAAVVIFIPKIRYSIHRLLSRIKIAVKAIFACTWSRSGTGNDKLDEILEFTGYSYDPEQDTFYSHVEAWQRNFGYCRLYDEAAAPLSMIIDCEPVYFEYENKNWLIELWKGQYALTTGCEIGIYSSEGSDLHIPGFYSGPFYHCAADEEMLEMSYTLKKNGDVLFERKGKHWWLTGFKLGMFSEPWELTMDVEIVLKDEAMCKAFIKGLKNNGYPENKITKNGKVVSFVFDETFTPQPFSRTEEVEWIIQRKNEILCDMYQKITGPYNTIPDKIKAIEEHAPEIYESVMYIGKVKEIYDVYSVISKYIN